MVKNKSKDEKIQLKSSLAHLLPIIRHLKKSNKTIIADDLNKIIIIIIIIIKIIKIMIIIIFFISSTCEEHTNKAQLQKQDRNIEHIYIIYIIGLVLIFKTCLFIYLYSDLHRFIQNQVTNIHAVYDNRSRQH